MSTLNDPRTPRTTPDVLALRRVFDAHGIMVSFNGPITATLIEEIGKALRGYMEQQQESPSAVSDVFSVYIEMTQNIRRYAQLRPEVGAGESASIIVSRDDAGRYMVSAGNTVAPEDGARLVERVGQLAAMDKTELKAAFKTQLRAPRDTLSGSAGLGLIDMARKASAPIACDLQPIDGARAFFCLRVIL